jgi:hypothetical protein
MLENLINLVREQAGDSIINNPAIPNERNDEAIATAGSSITSSLQNMLSNGGVKDVLQLFSGTTQVEQTSVAQNVSGNMIQDLMNKFNLDQGSASNIAGGLLPNVLKNLVNKTNDPNDSSFDIQGIFNNLSGGKTSGMNIQGLLGKFKSGAFDADGDGDTDLQDVMAMFSGNNAGGGILDKLKSLVG